MLQIFKKIKNALSKTREFFANKIYALFSSKWNEETLSQLEQILYEADIGTIVTEGFLEDLKKFLKETPQASPEEILHRMKRYAASLLPPIPPISYQPLTVILIVGVNGSGKTTSIAKLAYFFKHQGRKVLLGAADTFRTGAIEQLNIWAQNIGVDIVKSLPQSDPSSVTYDTLTAAKNRLMDVVLIDTAGRLQNKVDLMNELSKIRRVCHKVIPNAPHEVFLVLDATTGQNALEQARVFHQFTPLTGLIITKLDGSSKGGVILSICSELKIPVRWVGVGEQMEDLIPFNSSDYIEGLFEKS